MYVFDGVGSDLYAARNVILEDPQTTAADDYLRINKSKDPCGKRRGASLGGMLRRCDR